MKVLNVRCCCDGTKVLGTLQVSDVALERRYFAVEVIDRRRPPLAAAAAVPVGRVAISSEAIYLREFWNGGEHELSVYSDDRPVEFWRMFSSFAEGARV